MLKSMKTFVYLLVIPVFVYLQSCTFSPDDLNERTEELELQEISATIAKLETAGYDIDTTDLGVYYIMHEQGTGPMPVKGDTCFVEYAAYFIDGVLLDASQDHFPDGIWELIFMEEEIIIGFTNGLSILQKGGEADLLIPSKYAYGPYGTQGVPEYTPLIFSVKLHNLKPKVQ